MSQHHDERFRVSRRDLLRLGALVGAAVPAARLLAQDPNPSTAKAAEAGQTPKFSTDVSVVTVLVAVRDKQGKIVHDMLKDDFAVEEDGKPQTLKYFSQQADLPLTLGLLVDTSGSQLKVITQERNASYDFLQHVMREDKDRAFVIHFDREVELLQDLTSSRQDLNKSLEQLESRPRLRRSGDPQSSDPDSQGGTSQSGGGYPGNGGGYPRNGQGGGRQGGGRGGAGTTMYDAILLASDEIMKKQQGRKALMLLSDGVDRGSKVSLTSAIESAQRADTLVYSIRFADSNEGGYGNGGFTPRIGMGGGGMGGGMGGGRRGGGNRMPQQEHVDGKKILEQISRETGGAYFEVSNKMPLSKIFDQIEEDLRNQYSLGYSYDPSGSSYRRIKVTTSRKNMVLTAREGYYAR